MDNLYSKIILEGGGVKSLLFHTVPPTKKTCSQNLFLAISKKTCKSWFNPLIKPKINNLFYMSILKKKQQGKKKLSCSLSIYSTTNIDVR